MLRKLIAGVMVVVGMGIPIAINAISNKYIDPYNIKEIKERVYYEVDTTYECKTSYYAHYFHGRTTANGEKFDMYAMTAAHKKLPFGTIVKVRNIGNDSTIIVRINDRGPYIKGRELDLSLGAAMKLDMISAGVIKIELSIIRYNLGPIYPEKNITQMTNTMETLWFYTMK